MIHINDDGIRIDTPRTTLLFQKIDVKGKDVGDKALEINLKPIHYGVRLNENEQYSVLSQKDASKNASISCFGNFDKREPLLSLINGDGSVVNDFDYVAARKVSRCELPAFPSAHTVRETLEIEYFDARCGLRLFNYLCIFEDTDVITSFYKLVNESRSAVKIRRLMSLQCDIFGNGFKKYSFPGDWISERMLETAKLGVGISVHESLCGMSSHMYNPFFMLEREPYHDWYAFNILYSSNYKASVEVSFNHTARVLMGINDFSFEYDLKAGESFVTPQAIQVYAQDKDSVIREMHNFVNNHIVRGKFAKQERPVLINSWEAAYFNYTEEKLLALAERAKDIGVELFVLDDGWFSDRNDDRHGLGDWNDNTEKTGGGLRCLAEKIRALGLKFGIWIEPEMVNPASRLYKSHPEWASGAPGRPLREGRHQYVLDLANPAVADMIAEVVSDIISRCSADYVKWDYNRCITEFYSETLKNQGEYAYRYMQGFYRLLKTVTEKFPNVLFEGCAGGGGRFDLGLMCYMPQVWASDNTDARVRLKIQEGTLYGYPQSVMTSHVSIAPNHQTLNSNSLESRFNIAAAGVLGYEYDLTSAEEDERACMKEQIAFYKRHRRLFQFGQYRLLQSCSDDCGGYASYMVVSQDKSEAIATIVLHDWNNYSSNKIRFGGLEDDALYSITMRKQANVSETVEFTAYGSLLNGGLLDFGCFSDECGRIQNSNGIFSRMFYFKKLN